MRLALLVPVALLTAACSGAFGTGPGAGDKQPVVLRIDAAGLDSTDPGTGELRTPTVATDSKQIIVKGRLSAGNPCQRLSAVAEWSEPGKLVLTVTAVAENVICIAAIAGFSYTATVQDLAPGAYHLVVVHATEAAGRQRHESRVLETDIVVP
jgi:hypothetical protein